MNRREFMQCAAVLTAGATSFPSQWVMSREQAQFLAERPDYIDSAATTFFTPAQRAAVTAVAEQIIPATDTPGATDAGVAKYIELMVSDWFNDSERKLFMAGLADLQQRAGGHFEQSPGAAQLALLEELEAAASDAPWFQVGSAMGPLDGTAPFICQMKDLTVLGFMFSEVGGSQFLRRNPMGPMDGDIPLLATDANYVADLPTFRALAGDVNLG